MRCGALHGKLAAEMVAFWVTFSFVAELQALDADAIAALPTVCPRQFEGEVVRDVVYHGLASTRPWVVSRALSNRSGLPFSCARYRQERARLEGLKIFSAVRLVAHREPQGLRLSWSFVELLTWVAYPAVRRSDLYGWLVGPALTSLNFLGQDIYLSAFLRTAVYPDAFVGTELLIEAESPWIGPDIPIGYELSLLRNQAFNETKHFHETSWDFVLSFYHRLSSKFRLIYEAELFQISPDPEHPYFTLRSNPAPVPILLDPGGDLVPGLGVGLLWDRRDRWVNPHAGVWQELRVAWHGGPLGGAADYKLLLLDHRSWWSHHWSGAQVTILHLSGLARLRPGRMGVYDYYVFGGPNSLRGVSLSSELYAQSEVLGTAELRHQLFERSPVSLLCFHFFWGLQLVLGADLAMMWRAHDPLLALPRTSGAVYAGLHILLPGLERIRLELGFHPDGKGGWKSGFTVGLFEKSWTQRLRQR